MSDRVIGVAVLDRYKQPNELRILCECKSGPCAGQCLEEKIPVYARGTPKPATCAWEFVEKGNILHMTPSVRVSTSRPQGETMVPVELFHNEGSWSIPFIECPNGYDSEKMFKIANRAKPHHHE